MHISVLFNACGGVIKVKRKMSNSLNQDVPLALPFKYYRVHVFTGWPGDPFAPGRPVSPCYGKKTPMTELTLVREFFALYSRGRDIETRLPNPLPLSVWC